MLAPWKKSYDQTRQHVKKQRYYFANKGPSSQSYGFSSGHVWMWELDYKESWAPKNWSFWTVVLEKTLESPLDSKEIQLVHPKGNKSSIFIGRTDVEAEAPILWPPDGKSWLIGKDPEAGRDWRQEEKGTTEDEMVGCHHWLDGYEFEQAPELVMDRETWWAAVHGIAKTWTWPRDWTEVICEGDCQQWVISFRGFPVGLVCEESACNAGEMPAMQKKQVWSWVRNIPLRRDGNPLQHSCPGSLMDRGATFSSSYILCKNPLNERDEHRNISVEMKG